MQVSFENYCKKLAAKMYSEDTKMVDYVCPAFDEPSHPWEDYFGEKHVHLREAAPLYRVGKSGNSFIHESLYYYFVFRQIFDLIKQSEDITKIDWNKLTNLSKKLLMNELLIQFFKGALYAEASFKEKLEILQIEARKKDEVIADDNISKILKPIDSLSPKESEAKDDKKEEEEQVWV